MNHYQFPQYDYGRGLKKSSDRDHAREILNAGIHSKPYFSRSYCGHEVIQVCSSRYAVGCDFENTDKFTDSHCFFTTTEEMNVMQNYIKSADKRIVRCTLWGLKESLAKLFQIPLRTFLASKPLRSEGGSLYIPCYGDSLFVYTELRSNYLIVITYYERI